MPQHTLNYLLYRQLIPALWLAWLLFWFVSALDTKVTRRREPLGSRLMFVVPVLIGALLLGSRHLPVQSLAQRLWPPSLAAYWSAVALVAAGLGFAVWARVHLGRNWSGTVTVKEGHELIRTGPYACVRHPIYTGLLVALIGTTLAVGNGFALLAFAIVLAGLLRKLRVEERFMRETFPGQYERYCEEVAALIPFAKARRSAPR